MFAQMLAPPPATRPVLAALLAFAAGGLGPVAVAETAAGPIEEVVVTGSRLRQQAAFADDLVHGIDFDAARQGRTALGEVLARLPVAGAPLLIRTLK